MILSSLAWSKDTTLENLVIRDGLYYEKFTDVPYTGNITGKVQGKINKGREDGPWLKYYDNGNLKSKTYYEDGLEHGEVFSYFENGQLKFKSIFKM